MNRRQILLWSSTGLLAVFAALADYPPTRAAEDVAGDIEYSAGILDTITGQTFDPLPSDDADRNGIPDNPFVTLPGVGELWASTLRVEETGYLKSVVAKRWNGASQNNEETFLIDFEVQRDANTPQRIVVETPHALAKPGEAMVLLVSLAPDSATLLGSEQAALLSPEPDGAIVFGGQYIEISVLVSTDNGLTYDDLDEARLATTPIRLVMGDLKFMPDDAPRFFEHPTYVHSDATTGFSIRATEGRWKPIDTKILHDGASAPGDELVGVSIESQLYGLSVFAPLFGVDIAELEDSSDSSESGHTTGRVAGATVSLAGTAPPTSAITSDSGGSTERSRASGRSLSVWVDFDYLGPEDGSQAQPFNLFAEGVFVVTAGGTINLKPGVSSEAFTVSKAMTLTAVGGTARIGDNAAVRDVIINEFVPTNLSGLQDEDSSEQDWIELFNAGTASISLDGWGLSNDSANLFKWTFPNVSIPAGGYLVVFASGKNRTPTNGDNLHTNYTLAASGDDMVLTTPGPTSISPTSLSNYTAVNDDNALARFPEGSGAAFQETNNPTPGAQNEESSATVILDPGHGNAPAGDSATTGQSGVGTTSSDATNTPEYRGTWLVAQQVKDRINTLDPSIDVIITKPTETGNISNLERARQLGDNGASLFVSLHFDGNTASGAPRRTFAIALPELFQETIGGVLFKTNNRNQADEIVFGQALVDAVIAAFSIPGTPASQNGGVRVTGTDANKGVLFETTPDWVSNVGPGGEMWEERLYHTNPSTPTPSRGMAVIIEIDNYKNIDVDLWLNDPVTSRPTPSRYQPISNAIAQVIVDEVNN